MTLSASVKAFESRFEEVVSTKNLDEDPSLPRVCAGGLVKDAEIFPALWASEELAAEAWLETATSHAGYARAKLEWVLKPELLEFQITMADRLQRHRLVANRFTVKSQFRVSN